MTPNHQTASCVGEPKHQVERQVHQSCLSWASNRRPLLRSASLVPSAWLKGAKVDWLWEMSQLMGFPRDFLNRKMFTVLIAHCTPHFVKKDDHFLHKLVGHFQSRLRELSLNKFSKVSTMDTRVFVKKYVNFLHKIALPFRLVVSDEYLFTNWLHAFMVPKALSTCSH